MSRVKSQPVHPKDNRKETQCARLDVANAWPGLIEGKDELKAQQLTRSFHYSDTGKATSLRDYIHNLEHIILLLKNMKPSDWFFETVCEYFQTMAPFILQSVSDTISSSSTSPSDQDILVGLKKSLQTLFNQL